jgi:glycosyltransferase involved in cell wall biosynthesis
MPPAYGIPFRPRPKKKQVVYVTFLAPQKRIDDFIEIARALPEYKFVLLGRDTQTMNEIYKGYAERILANVPNNVQYVESRIRQAPEFLEESKVYLHTSSEPGMGIAVMEALSAGCVPVAPRNGGAAEILSTAGIGFCYDRIQDSVGFIKSEMEDASWLGPKGRRLAPKEIAEKATIFSPQAFQVRISDLLETVL